MTPNAVEVEGALRMAVGLVDDIEKLVRLANDPAASMEERHTAAMAACQRIYLSGALPKLRALKDWFDKNAAHFTRAGHLAALVQSFRRR